MMPVTGAVGIASSKSNTFGFHPNTSSNGHNPSKLGVLYELYASIAKSRKVVQFGPNSLKWHFRISAKLLMPCCAKSDL